jgi:hypothetical protein
MSKSLSLKSDEYEIELNLRDRITVISGDSATGKTFMYDLIQDADNTDDIVTLNYNSVKTKANYEIAVDSIKNSRNKIFIIDQADDIQRENDEIMYAINTEAADNTFIIMGRKPKLVYNVSDIAEVNIQNNKVTLNYLFPEPLI